MSTNILQLVIQGFFFGLGFAVAMRLVNGLVGLLGGNKQ